MTNSPRFIQVQNAESADRQLGLHRKQALSTAILESHGSCDLAYERLHELMDGEENDLYPT